MSENVMMTELKDYIKSNVDLMDYINTFYPYIQFSGKGSTSKAICPLPTHSEKTGSFSIKKGEQNFKCYGCGESGDVISFVEKMEGVEFLEALDIISENMGYNVIKKTSTLPAKQKKFFNKLVEHNKRYRANLSNSEEAMEYLTKVRRISKETIDDFKLGLTDKEEDKLRENLKGRINNAITFPLFFNSPNKEVVANAYKPLDENSNPKYINDGAGFIKKASNGFDFVKSDLLYGYPQAFKYIRGLKEVNIVEGYFDVIAMHEADIKNTVGIMCATISDAQILALKRICNKVNIMFDNDIAGNKGKKEAILKFLENGFEVNVFESKELKDADDICKKHLFIKEEVLNYIEERTYDAVTYYINESMLQYETSILKAQEKAYKESIYILSKLQDDVYKSFHLSRLKKRLDLK